MQNGTKFHHAILPACKLLCYNQDGLTEVRHCYNPTYLNINNENFFNLLLNKSEFWILGLVEILYYATLLTKKEKSIFL